MKADPLGGQTPPRKTDCPRREPPQEDRPPQEGPPPPGRQTRPLEGRPAPCPQAKNQGIRGQCKGSTHPTGMHSCLFGRKHDNMISISGVNVMADSWLPSCPSGIECKKDTRFQFAVETQTFFVRQNKLVHWSFY